MVIDVALEEQLNRADEKCHYLKNRLDYMKRLYHSVGPMDMDPCTSPRLSVTSSSQIPPIPVINEDLYDAENVDEKTRRAEPIERSTYSPDETDVDDSEKLVDRWSQKSIQKVYSAHRFFTSSNQELLETLSNKPELILNLTGRREKPERLRKVVKSRAIYSTRSSKPEAGRRDLSPSKAMKIKRRRTRLKTSNSKSTTASKHVTIPDPKHKKMKRPVNRPKETQIEGDEKNTTNRCNQEVVEIYHNAAVQSVQSFSESSSKPQLKLPAETPDPARVTKKASPKIPEVSHPPSDVKRTPPQTDVLRRREADVRNAYECQPIRWCYNPLGLPNYQQPTLASKSKRVNRCYLTARFNLRNIPFVVGTSVTPSHNLGLNIQQALSLMKTKQAALATEMRPFFIKKLGQGLDPVFCIQQAMLNQLPTAVSDATGIDTSPTKLESQQINATEKVPQNGLKQQKGELKHMESRLPSLPTTPSDSPNIKNVFMRLHSKFEEMQMQYDKLQEQAAKSKDEKLLKQISELEDELNAKESEIEAIVGLYTEVMTLKSQIHNTYHQRSSLLCITDCGKFPTRAQPVNHMIYQKPRGSLCTGRVPSMSMRLTGLLRQIQSFQQQLIAS